MTKPVATAMQFSDQQVMRIAQRAVDLYVSRHPRPVQVTITQAAQMLGLSRPTVRNLMKAGKLSFNKCGMIPIEQIGLALCTRLP
jgi:hypothetical protein